MQGFEPSVFDIRYSLLVVRYSIFVQRPTSNVRRPTPTEVITYPRASDFLNQAESWLLENEVENNLILSVAGQVAADDADSDQNLFGTLESSGSVVGCFFRTPPWKLCVSVCPAESIDRLVDHVYRRYPSLPGVLGPPGTARPFAMTWARNLGQTFREIMRQRIYLLRAVQPPPRMPAGSARQVSLSDLQLLADWLIVFYDELGFPLPDAQSAAERTVGRGDAWFWCDPEPVSLGIYTGYTQNGVRIGTVYTPVEHRRQGYASAITFEMSRKALESGRKFCFLFADTANPTSNRIYQRIGYEPMSDIVDYAFEPQR